MPRFILGDDLGNLKVLRYNPNATAEPKAEVKILSEHDKSGPARCVQSLAAKEARDGAMLVSTFSDGHCSLASLSEDDELSIHCSWQETRMKGGKFIGTSITKNATMTCTASGMLRRIPYNVEGESIKISEPTVTTLPSRLFDWRQSSDGVTFAYGGDEVDVSVWDTERAFQTSTDGGSTTTSSTSKKRKRNDDLFPAEVWRARNLPNDILGLRQPVRISALGYLQSSSSGHHLVVGTQFGDVRRYDTKAGRRPVSNWKGIARVGGVKAIEKGFTEHEIFVADGGSSLYAVDLRSGGILNGYRGISGAVSSIASSPTVMASAALDRFARVHSSVAPPPKAGTHQERRGEVLEKVFLNSSPTVIVWDQCIAAEQCKTNESDSDEGDEDDEETWKTMEHIS